MRLHHAAASPFVRKVMVLLHETGLIDQVEIRSLAVAPAAPVAENTAANPLGKLPCLERDDGPALYDSRVITRYLDSLQKGRGLYPDPPALWDVLTLEATADGIMDAGVLCIYEGRFREETQRSDAWLDGQRGKINRGLDAIEARWTPTLAGPLTMAHVAVGCALGYLDFRQPVGEWRGDRPGLAGWFETFSARPSMQATIPKG